MSFAQRLKELLSGTSGEPAAKPQTGPLNGQAALAKEGAASPENPTNYAEIWNQNLPPEPGSSKIFNTNQEEFGKVVGGMDFIRNAPRELMEKALGGDQQALMQLVNKVGQNAFSTAAISAREMVEHANSSQQKSIEKLVQEQVRSALASQTMSQKNQSFSDPLVAPLIQDISARLRAKFPEATPQELASKSEEMLMSLAGKIVSGSPQEQERIKSQEMQKASATPDWEAWASADESTMGASPSRT